MDNADTSPAEAFCYPAVAYSLRVNLWIGSVLAGAASAFALWYTARLPQTVGPEALWCRSHAALWALWACLWWLHVAVSVSRWRGATPEQKRAPWATTTALRGVSVVWQFLQTMAIFCTLQSYRWWHGSGGNAYVDATPGLYMSYVLLSVMLAWALVHLARSRNRRAV